MILRRHTTILTRRHVLLLSLLAPLAACAGDGGPEAPVYQPANYDYLTRLRLKVAKIDIDAEQSLAARYGIKSVPTIALFRRGAGGASSGNSDSVHPYRARSTGHCRNRDGRTWRYPRAWSARRRCAQGLHAGRCGQYRPGPQATRPPR